VASDLAFALQAAGKLVAGSVARKEFVIVLALGMASAL
jgi:hypothetical protein